LPSLENTAISPLMLTGQVGRASWNASAISSASPTLAVQILIFFPDAIRANKHVASEFRIGPFLSHG
jgi:hypothetical protein